MVPDQDHEAPTDYDTANGEKCKEERRADCFFKGKVIHLEKHFNKDAGIWDGQEKNNEYGSKEKEQEPGFPLHMQEWNGIESGYFL